MRIRGEHGVARTCCGSEYSQSILTGESNLSLLRLVIQIHLQSTSFYIPSHRPFTMRKLYMNASQFTSQFSSPCTFIMPKLTFSEFPRPPPLFKPPNSFHHPSYTSSTTSTTSTTAHLLVLLSLPTLITSTNI